MWWIICIIIAIAFPPAIIPMVIVFIYYYIKHHNQNQPSNSGSAFTNPSNQSSVSNTNVKESKLKLEVIDSVAVIEFACNLPEFKDKFKMYYPALNNSDITPWVILYMSLFIYIQVLYEDKSETITISNKDVKHFLDHNFEGYFSELMYMQKHGSYGNEELFKKAYNVISWMFDPSDYNKTYKVSLKLAEM